MVAIVSQGVRFHAYPTSQKKMTTGAAKYDLKKPSTVLNPVLPGAATMAV